MLFLKSTPKLPLVVLLLAVLSHSACTMLEDCKQFAASNDEYMINCESVLVTHKKDVWYKSTSRQGDTVIIAQLAIELDTQAFDSMRVGIKLSFIGKIGDSPYFYVFPLGNYSIIERESMEEQRLPIEVLWNAMLNTLKLWKNMGMRLGGRQDFVTLYRNDYDGGEIAILDPGVFTTETEVDPSPSLSAIMSQIVSAVPSEGHNYNGAINIQSTSYYLLHLHVKNQLITDPNIDFSLAVQRTETGYAVVNQMMPSEFNKSSYVIDLIVPRIGRTTYDVDIRRVNFEEISDPQSPTNNAMATHMTFGYNLGVARSSAAVVEDDSLDSVQGGSVNGIRGATLFAVVMFAAMMIAWGYYLSKWAGISARDEMVVT